MEPSNVGLLQVEDVSGPVLRKVNGDFIVNQLSAQSSEGVGANVAVSVVSDGVFTPNLAFLNNGKRNLKERKHLLF